MHVKIVGSLAAEVRDMCYAAVTKFKHELLQLVHCLHSGFGANTDIHQCRQHSTRVWHAICCIVASLAAEIYDVCHTAGPNSVLCMSGCSCQHACIQRTKLLLKHFQLSRSSRLITLQEPNKAGPNAVSCMSSCLHIWIQGADLQLLQHL